jgi:hypothetical protein
LDSKVIYKSDTVFSSKKLNQVDKVNPDSITKSMLGTWYAHIFKSNSDYILLTKNNSDYSFDFTSTFNKDFSYAAQLRFIENKQERGLNQGQWILNPNKVLNVHFNNGIDQSFKIAYLAPDIIILNLN